MPFVMMTSSGPVYDKRDAFGTRKGLFRYRDASNRKFENQLQRDWIMDRSEQKGHSA